tara:strand:- start:68 stop:223 length:156 start_codon:yes stop_codon:yes gene_type:complete
MTMSTIANEINLENRTEEIFEDMMKSFKDLTLMEERIVYHVAGIQAQQETT